MMRINLLWFFALAFLDRSNSIVNFVFQTVKTLKIQVRELEPRSIDTGDVSLWRVSKQTDALFTFTKQNDITSSCVYSTEPFLNVIAWKFQDNICKMAAFNSVSMSRRFVTHWRFISITMSCLPSYKIARAFQASSTKEGQYSLYSWVYCETYCQFP